VQSIYTKTAGKSLLENAAVLNKHKTLPPIWRHRAVLNTQNPLKANTFDRIRAG
jgi:hypothetical protein